MLHYVYILLSRRKNKYITYIGYTNNLKKRLHLHNNSKGAKFTKGSIWKIIYKKKFLYKNKALKYEYYLKKNRSLRLNYKKKAIKNLDVHQLQ